MEKNTVSIIIPVYNVSPYLREALDSVIHQSYTNLEIIIIDDGSTDGSGAICDEYASKDSRIRVIHQENRGLSAARNRGLDSMTGDLVAFLDPDDAFHPDFIQEMVSAMIRTSADLAVCRYSIQYTTGKLEHASSLIYPTIQSGLYDREEAVQALFGGTFNVNVWNKLYKRKLWDNIRFFEGHVYEDTEVAYKINSISQRVCVLNDALYFHRKRPGSITDTVTVDNIHDRVLAATRVNTYIRSHTPNSFSEIQLQQQGQSFIYALVYCYIKLLSIKDAKAEQVELRQQIIKAGKQSKLSSFRATTANYMIRYCPKLLRIVYPIYRFMRILARKPRK